MKEKLLIITAFLCFLLCSLILFFFRTIPAGKIWRAYTVVYAEKKAEPETIIGLLSKAGIEGVLSSMHEPFPPPSPFTPVQNEFCGSFSYSDLQSLFFSDKSDSFRLYYIPEQKTQKAAEALKNSSVTWGIIGSNGDWRILPAAVFILFLCFVFFAKNRLFFICSFFPLACYTVSAPFYHSSSFVCIIGFSLFIVQKFWKRRGFFKRILMQKILPTSIFSLFFSASVSSMRQTLLLCSALGCSYSLVYLLHKVENFLRKKKCFKPVSITSALMIPVSDVFCFRFALIPVLCVSFFLALLIYNSTGDFGKRSKDLYIPAPLHKTAQKDFSELSYTNLVNTDVPHRLPDLTDFIHAFWFMQTYPFRKLESLPGKIEKERPLIDEKIEYADYKKNIQSLKEVPVTVAVFDVAYISNITQIAKENSAVAQKNKGGAQVLLAKQSGFTRTVYKRSVNVSADTLSLVFTLAAFTYILFVLSALRIKRL